jgi:organic hydroperoxide reductase OsmC/OhrA
MQAMPHHYRVTAAATATGNVDVASPGLPGLVTAPPAEFGGPGNLWSPETLLVAAVADCFVLTFRAIARASKLDWVALECGAEGVLDRVDGVTRFTSVTVRARLTVPAGASESLARRLLEKAEHGCLVTNSLRAERHLEATVTVAA